MFRVIPLRMSMWRAGWVMLTLSLIASYIGVCTDRLASPGIAVAPPSNVRSWVAFAVGYTCILVCGWLTARDIWSTWRREIQLAQSDTVAQTPSTRVRWTWTMKQVVVGVLMLVVGIWSAVQLADTVDAEFRLIIVVAVALGTIGVAYLMLARRVGNLEHSLGIVYYWQRQPGILSFSCVGVCMVPVYAVLW